VVRQSDGGSSALEPSPTAIVSDWDTTKSPADLALDRSSVGLANVTIQALDFAGRPPKDGCPMVSDGGNGARALVSFLAGEKIVGLRPTNPACSGRGAECWHKSRFWPRSTRPAAAPGRPAWRR
jgi:hypothetical protein